MDNLGGRSYLNLWAPGVGSQIFSLSQQWYAGGSPVQTVEIGWQVYPGKYGTTNGPPTATSTPGATTSTARRSSRRTANWALGGQVGPLSVYGGAQYSLALTAYLSGGN